jgi:hypothetical protein
VFNLQSAVSATASSHNTAGWYGQHAAVAGAVGASPYAFTRTESLKDSSGSFSSTSSRTVTAWGQPELVHHHQQQQHNYQYSLMHQQQKQAAAVCSGIVAASQWSAQQAAASGNAAAPAAGSAVTSTAVGASFDCRIDSRHTQQMTWYDSSNTYNMTGFTLNHQQLGLPQTPQRLQQQGAHVHQGLQLQQEVAQGLQGFSSYGVEPQQSLQPPQQPPQQVQQLGLFGPQTNLPPAVESDFNQLQQQQQKQQPQQ